MFNPNNFSNPEVAKAFDSYPDYVRYKMLNLRSLVFEVASDLELNDLEETLRWGEPSYITKKGSTLRMDWKERSPDQYALYFKCTSKLVPSFRAVFKDLFEFEKNRAIVFSMEENLPKKQLKACIKSALSYHKIKHLPYLGMADIVETKVKQ